MYCIYLLPIRDLTFQTPNWIYFWKEALNFNVVQVITLHLLCNSAFLCCFYFNFFVLKILYQHHKDILTYYILKYYFPFIFRSRIHLKLTIAYETPVSFLFFSTYDFGDNRGWDGWMALPTRWAWVWVNSRSWWWAGRSGVLQFMGS